MPINAPRRFGIWWLRDNEHEEFLAGYGALLREAYPARDGRTVFPFKRTFVVATKIY